MITFHSPLSTFPCFLSVDNNLNSSLVFIFITIFVDLLGYGIMLPLLPFYVQAQDGGAAIAGALSSLYAGTQLFAGPILGALSDRFGRRPVLLVCLFGTSLGYFMGRCIRWRR